jgi:hypothetical protein
LGKQAKEYGTGCGVSNPFKKHRHESKNVFREVIFLKDGEVYITWPNSTIQYLQQ